MDPEYDLTRIGYPYQVDRLVELLDDVWQDHIELSISHNGVVVAVAVHPDELALLRQRIADLSGEQSGEPKGPDHG